MLFVQVGAFLVASGTKGKRFALPNARFRMENPRVDPIYDQKGNARVILNITSVHPLNIIHNLYQNNKYCQRKVPHGESVR